MTMRCLLTHSPGRCTICCGKSDQVVALTAAPYVDVTYPSADLASGKPKLYSIKRLSIKDVMNRSVSATFLFAFAVVSHEAVLCA